MSVVSLVVDGSAVCAGTVGVSSSGVADGANVVWASEFSALPDNAKNEMMIAIAIRARFSGMT